MGAPVVEYILKLGFKGGARVQIGFDQRHEAEAVALQSGAVTWEIVERRAWEAQRMLLEGRI